MPGFVLAAALAAASITALAQNNPRDAQRLITAMRISPGMTVGEIGAGTGGLTILMAQHVGAAGKVFTTEINEARLGDTRNAVAAAGVGNVTVLVAGAESSNLPAGCCDAIFMRNVYHHFSNPAAISATLLAALKPGGRLAIIDFPPGNGPEGATPADRAKDGTHGVKKETVAAELEKAGFVRISAEEPGGAQEGFLVLVRK
ncbi:MAG: methyltransferase domain-containing protein [Acidobacteriota bacterium]|nr:methyltransferase domain-containing protein [Acidobacteriota bacterium]